LEDQRIHLQNSHFLQSSHFYGHIRDSQMEWCSYQEVCAQT
jgi:hypothetical protein